MQFVNETGNTIRLSDTGQVIPFLGKQPQSIESDDIKRSKMFQMLCISKKFTIFSVSQDRIEQNLWRIQNGQTPIPEDRIEVMVRGHFFSNSGYGKANRNLVYALGRAGVRVGIETSMDSDAPLNQMELEKIARFRRELPNAICIDSMIPSFSEPTQYRYKILNTTVEAASVPIQFVDVCNEYDEIWVASKFCKDVFSDYGVDKPIFILPNAVESKLYNPQAVPHTFTPPLKKFVFVSVLSWSHRKGYDALIKAYVQEFSDSDDVTLLLVTPYDGVDDEAEQYIKTMTECSHAPMIARAGREIPEYEMPRVYKACDCFVLPSRGEGFGLPYVEAGMCGLPIIATNHSGHTMFLNKKNSYLVDVDKISELADGMTKIHYWDGQLFPELTDDKVIAELGRLMRQVQTDYPSALKRSELLQQALTSYSLESVGQLAVERLKPIWKTLSSY